MPSGVNLSSSRTRGLVDDPSPGRPPETDVRGDQLQSLPEKGVPCPTEIHQPLSNQLGSALLSSCRDKAPR